jgi:hypothetical protein
MFEHLTRFDRILVTGPQRAGTRICATMIAHDTGHRFVDEREFGTGDFDRLNQLLLAESNIVVQCPALSTHIDRVVVPLGSKMIAIWMERSLSEIKESQQRIHWSPAAQRKMLFDRLAELPIAELKRIFWEWQKHHLFYNRSHEVFYVNLRKHPLWVDDREGWAWDQTS